jgi:hypothetical protein
MRSVIPDDPEADGTDNAHPAFWRGQDDGVRGATMRIMQAIEGRDDGSGVIGDEGLEKARRAILAMRKKIGFLEVTDEEEQGK